MTAANPAAVCEWCYGPLTGVEPRIAHYRALHERIRELETKLRRYAGRIYVDGPAETAWTELKARAERAEARIAELEASQ